MKANENFVSNKDSLYKRSPSAGKKKKKIPINFITACHCNVAICKLWCDKSEWI